MGHLAKLLTVALLLLPPLPRIQATEETYRYAVLGAAIDRRGRPVPFAHVVVTPGPRNRGGDFVYSDTADAEGRIRFEVPDSNLVRRTRLMFVTGPLPPNAVAPVAPPFTDFPALAGPAYAGRRILIRKGGGVDVGDVRVQVFYGVVKVFLRDRRGAPLVKEADAWRYVWLRVRDRRGNIVTETSISRAQIEKAVDLSQSSVAVALPQGIWYVEVSLHEDKGPWLTSRSPLHIQGPHKQSQLILSADRPYNKD